MSTQQQQPILSIVIPVHNQSAYTRGCLASLQLHPPDLPYEIIVVDDGSTDDTVQVVASFNDLLPIRLVKNLPPHRFARACNRGAAEAKGQLLLLLNNDTEALLGWWPPLYRAISANPKIGIVTPLLLLPNRNVQHCGKVWVNVEAADSQPYHLYYRFSSNHLAVQKSRFFQLVTGACILVRTAEFLQLGGFDETYINGWEDDDLCYAYRNQGQQIFFCGQSSLIHHQNKTVSEKLKGLLAQLPEDSVLEQLDQKFSSGLASAEEQQQAERIATARQAVQQELQQMVTRFQHNRSHFFSKWAGQPFNDLLDYCQQDGVSPYEALQGQVDDDVITNLLQQQGVAGSARGLANRETVELPAKVAEIWTSNPSSTPSGHLLPKGEGGRRPGEGINQYDNLFESTSVESNTTIGLVSLIILTYNRLDVTKACLESIRRHTPEPHEIIIIDNGSSDGSREWLQQRVTEQSTIRLIENQENLGFSAGCNQGMQAAKGDYLLLINNDTVVTPGWLSGLLEPFKYPKTGIVGPITNSASGIQEWPWLEYQNLAELDGFATKLRQQQRYWWIKCPRIVGFCMLFRRSLMEQIGLLDEHLDIDNIASEDYCLRAALVGYQNLVLGDVFIHHVGSATFSGNQLDYRAAMLRNRNLFTEKWSKPPEDEQQAAQIIRFKVLEAAQELLDKGDANAAVEQLLHEGIARLPDETDFYLLMARIFLDAQLPKDAMDVLKEAPEEREVSLLKARGLLELGQLENALSVLEELSSTNQPELEALRGLLFERLGQSVEACQQYSQALLEQSNNQLALSGLSCCYLQQGDKTEALLLLQRSVACGYGTAALAVWHGLLNSGQDLQQATEFLSRMQHCYSNLQLLSNLRIDLLLRQGDDQAAMAEIEQLMATATLGDSLLAAALEVRSRLGIRKPDPKRLQQGITVTLAMMVKDEEDNLPRCLASVAPLVDEIVIVDTGSSDRTVQIATAYGAKVLHQPWAGDYSASRNKGIDVASCNWILSLDADEVISEQDHDLFLHLIKSMAGQKKACTVTTRNYTNRLDCERWQPNQGEYQTEETGRGWFPSSKVRIFPNLPGVRFENPIHEMVEDSLERLQINCLDTDLVIHHYGCLDQVRQQRKLEFYYQLSKKKYEQTNGDFPAAVELAIQSADTGRYGEAITLWQSVLKKAPDYALGWFNLGYACLKQGDFHQGGQAGRKAAELKDNYREAAVNTILCDLALGRLQDARQLLDDFLPNNSNYPMLQLCQAVLLGLEGKQAEAAVVFNKLKSDNIEIDSFLDEVVGYLQQGGQGQLAGLLSSY